METILKLLKSKTKEDILVGFHLLLQHPGDVILEFFRKNHSGSGEYPGAYDIRVALGFEESPIPEATYIDLGHEYRLVNAGGDLRLRDINSYDYVQQHRVISKENYLNGMY